MGPYMVAVANSSHLRSSPRLSKQPASHNQFQDCFADVATMERSLGYAASNNDRSRGKQPHARRSSRLAAKRQTLPDTPQVLPDKILGQSTIESAIETSIAKVTVAGEDAVELIQRVLHFDDLPKWMQTDPYIKHGYRRELKSFGECCRSLFYPHNEFVNTWSHLLPAFFFLSLVLAADYHVLYGPTQVSWMDNLAIQLYVAGTAGCLFLSVSVSLPLPSDIVHTEPERNRTAFYRYQNVVLVDSFIGILPRHQCPLGAGRTSLP